MRIGTVILILLVSLPAFSQDDRIIAIDAVKIIGGHRAEALYYYEKNWLELRKMAEEEGFIDSFEFIELSPAAGTAFDLILITRYSSERQFEMAEENFGVLISWQSGLILLHKLKPNEFRTNVFSANGKSPRMFHSVKKYKTDFIKEKR